jgi:hypothetical protein
MPLFGENSSEIECKRFSSTVAGLIKAAQTAGTLPLNTRFITPSENNILEP